MTILRIKRTEKPLWFPINASVSGVYPDIFTIKEYALSIFEITQLVNKEFDQSKYNWFQSYFHYGNSVRDKKHIRLCFNAKDIHNVFPDSIIPMDDWNNIITMDDWWRGHVFISFIEGRITENNIEKLHEISNHAKVFGTNTLLPLRHQDFLNLMFRLINFLYSDLSLTEESFFSIGQSFLQIEDQLIFVIKNETDLESCELNVLVPFEFILYVMRLLMVNDKALNNWNAPLSMHFFMEIIMDFNYKDYSKNAPFCLVRFKD